MKNHERFLPLQREVEQTGVIWDRSRFFINKIVNTLAFFLILS